MLKAYDQKAVECVHLFEDQGESKTRAFHHQNNTCPMNILRNIKNPLRLIS